MAKLPRMQRFDLKNDLLNRFQQVIAKVLDRVSDVPFLDGKLFKDVEILIGINEINHGLGRTPQGFFVIKYGPTGFAELNQESANSTSLVFSSSATITADLWVY